MLSVYISGPYNTLNSRPIIYVTRPGGYLRGISNWNLLSHPSLPSCTTPLPPAAQAPGPGADLISPSLSHHIQSIHKPHGLQLQGRFLPLPFAAAPGPSLQHLLPWRWQVSPKEVSLLPHVPHTVYVYPSSQGDSMKTRVTTRLCAEPSSNFPRAQSRSPGPVEATFAHSSQPHLLLNTELFPPPDLCSQGLSLFCFCYAPCCTPST